MTFADPPSRSHAIREAEEDLASCHIEVDGGHNALAELLLELERYINTKLALVRPELFGG